MNKFWSGEYDYVLYAWSVDFVRCVESMPTWRKWIIRIVLGKYASREYVGLREHIDTETYGSTPSSQIGYGLEETDYNQESFRWLKAAQR